MKNLKKNLKVEQNIKAFRQSTISSLGSRISEVKILIPIDNDVMKKIINNVTQIISHKEKAKLYAQHYSMLKKSENLMGIKNKAKIGNL